LGVLWKKQEVEQGEASVTVHGKAQSHYKPTFDRLQIAE
jgi:hypothetical protein